MSRLEEIEAMLTGVEPGFIPVPKEMLLYSLDCYRARVDVLEEACKLADKPFYLNTGFTSDPDDYSYFKGLFNLSPEQCLKRQKGVG